MPAAAGRALGATRGNALSPIRTRSLLVQIDVRLTGDLRSRPVVFEGKPIEVQW